MQKINLDPSLKDWIAYLNERYKMGGGGPAEDITPREIENTLLMFGLIVPRQKRAKKS